MGNGSVLGTGVCGDLGRIERILYRIGNCSCACDVVVLTEEEKGFDADAC